MPSKFAKIVKRFRKIFHILPQETDIEAKEVIEVSNTNENRYYTPHSEISNQINPSEWNKIHDSIIQRHADSQYLNITAKVGKFYNIHKCDHQARFRRRQNFLEEITQLDKKIIEIDSTNSTSTSKYLKVKGVKRNNLIDERRNLLEKVDYLQSNYFDTNYPLTIILEEATIIQN
jgi:hypothetical protein